MLGEQIVYGLIEIFLVTTGSTEGILLHRTSVYSWHERGGASEANHNASQSSMGSLWSIRSYLGNGRCHETSLSYFI